MASTVRFVPKADVLALAEEFIDIALRFEYESQPTFMRAFCRHYGMPPAMLRKIMRHRQSQSRKH